MTKQEKFLVAVLFLFLIAVFAGVFYFKKEKITPRAPYDLVKPVPPPTPPHADYVPHGEVDDKG